MEPSKKITLATVKSFIRKNAGELYIANFSYFDGMTDAVESCSNRNFRKAEVNDLTNKPFRSQGRDNTLGIAGAWFVFGSRDSFSEYGDALYSGVKVYNCCGSFVLAVRRPIDAIAAIAEMATHTAKQPRVQL